MLAMEKTHSTENQFYHQIIGLGEMWAKKYNFQCALALKCHMNVCALFHKNKKYFLRWKMAALDAFGKRGLKK